MNATEQKICLKYTRSNQRIKKSNAKEKVHFTDVERLCLCLLAAVVFLVFFMKLTIRNTEASAPALTCSYQSIEIHEGDTLWQMASDHAYPGQSVSEYITEIKAVNGLSTDTIHAGNHLILPVYCEIK